MMAITTNSSMTVNCAASLWLGLSVHERDTFFHGKLPRERGMANRYSSR